MKLQKGSAHVILVTGLVIALIGALGFIFWQNFIHKPDTSKASATHSTVRAKADTKAETNRNVDPTANWKTFTSPMSGYTVKYPPEWTVSQNSEIFKNSIGGTSHTFGLVSKVRTGSYDGHDANTYMCINLAEYSTAGWQDGYPVDKARLTALDKFNPNATTQLNLSLEDSAYPNPSVDMLKSIILTTDEGSDKIALSSSYYLNASAQFNCVQGDYNALKNSLEKFLARPETSTARTVLKSLRY